MFGLGSSAKKIEPVLIFHLGSGNVAATIVDIAPSAPVLLWSFRQEMPFHERLQFDRFRKGMIATLNVVAQTVQKEGLPKVGGHVPNQIIMVMASPWYVSQTALLKYDHKTPVTVDMHFDDIKRFLHEKKEALKNNTSGGTAVLVEQKIIQTSLNGYPTAHPYGKRVRSMETAVFLAMLGADVYRDVTDTVTRVFHRGPTTFHSFALASFTTMRNLFASEENFLLMDVGSEVTDIGIVRDGVLLETISFPRGKNFIYRSVAENLKTLPEETRSRIELYRSGSSNTVESGRISAALTAAGKEWQEQFLRSLAGLAKTTALPHTVLMTADPDLGEWFRVVLLDSHGGEFTLTGGPLSVILITPEQLQGRISLAPGVAPDSFLSLEGVFAKILASSSPL